jgi:hypothetical protein
MTREIREYDHMSAHLHGCLAQGKFLHTLSHAHCPITHTNKLSYIDRTNQYLTQKKYIYVKCENYQGIKPRSLQRTN